MFLPTEVDQISLYFSLILDMEGKKLQEKTEQ